MGLILAAFAIANAAPAELDLDAEEEFLTQEARGLLSKETKGELDECLGNYRNKFLTKITTREEFVECFKSVCSDEFSAVIDQVVDCVGLEEGVGRLEVRALLTKARGGVREKSRQRRQKGGSQEGQDDDYDQQRETRILHPRNEDQMLICMRETQTQCLSFHDDDDGEKMMINE